jgi:hypothetical protein
MGRIVSCILFPVTFTTAFVVALWGVEQSVDKDFLLAGITVGVMVVVALFERVLPEHKDWNRTQGDVTTDLLHGAISMVVLPQLLELGLRLLLLEAAIWLAGGSEGG